MKEDQHVLSRLKTISELLQCVSAPNQGLKKTLQLTVPTLAEPTPPKPKRPGTPAGRHRASVVHRVGHIVVPKSSTERTGISAAQLSHAAFLKPCKDVDFSELVTSLVPKVYKGWSKVSEL